MDGVGGGRYYCRIISASPSPPVIADKHHHFPTVNMNYVTRQVEIGGVWYYNRLYECNIFRAKLGGSIIRICGANRIDMVNAFSLGHIHPSVDISTSTKHSHFVSLTNCGCRE